MIKVIGNLVDEDNEDFGNFGMKIDYIIWPYGIYI